MRLGTPTRHVDLFRQTVGSAARQPDDDVLIGLHATCDGFSGHTSAWVPAPAWRKFLSALIELERSRQGHAELESWPFGDRFQLRIFSTDRAGHMAITGMIESILLEDGAGSLVFTFGQIAFDPPMLPDLVREMASD